MSFSRGFIGDFTQNFCWKENSLDNFFLLLSNVVGDKNLRSYLAFKGFRKENQGEVEKQDNATTDLQDNQIRISFLV